MRKHGTKINSLLKKIPVDQQTWKTFFSLNNFLSLFAECTYYVLSTGMMETVRIRRSGYPVRREFKDFLFRYGVLGREVGRKLNDKETCVAILMQYDATNKDWQLGKTKASSALYMYNHWKLIAVYRTVNVRWAVSDIFYIFSICS